MPPASAGSNGAYEPPPPHLREQLQAVRHPVGSAEDAALLVGDAAIAPVHRPARDPGGDQRGEPDHRPALPLGRRPRLVALAGIRLLGRGQLRPRWGRHDQPPRDLGRADALGLTRTGAAGSRSTPTRATSTRSSRACAGTPSASAAARAPAGIPPTPTRAATWPATSPVCRGWRRGPLARAPSTVFSGRVVPARLDQPEPTSTAEICGPWNSTSALASLHAIPNV